MIKALALSFFLLLLIGCSGTNPLVSEEVGLTPTVGEQSTLEVVIEEADNLEIDRVQVNVKGSSPIRVVAYVSGMLPDNCTSIVRIKADYADSEFHLKIITRREIGLECKPTLHAFEEFVFLDVKDLPMGTYKVYLNGLSDSFTLEEELDDPGDEGG